MQNMAQLGTNQMAATPSDMVAPLSTLQNEAIQQAPTVLQAYQSPLTAAQTAAGTSAGGVTGSQIGQFMDPYTTGYTDANGNVVPGLTQQMANLQQQNIQQNVLPQLQATFAGSGGFGSSRNQNAIAQMMAQMQNNLTAQQTGALNTAYSNAAQNALTNQANTTQAANALTNIGAQETTSGVSGLNEANTLGGVQQAYEQAKINAPLQTAQNAANLLNNFKVPSTVATTANAPIPGAYSNSPLSQIAGLTSLFGTSTAGGTSPIAGVYQALTGQPLSSSGGLLSGLGSFFNSGTDNSNNILSNFSNSSSSDTSSAPSAATLSDLSSGGFTGP
jgi:putative IMPACT (imprinted ancient) family translation regulator